MNNHYDLERTTYNLTVKPKQYSIILAKTANQLKKALNQIYSYLN